MKQVSILLVTMAMHDNNVLLEDKAIKRTTEAVGLIEIDRCSGIKDIKIYESTSAKYKLCFRIAQNLCNHNPEVYALWNDDEDDHKNGDQPTQLLGCLEWIQSSRQTFQIS